MTRRFLCRAFCVGVISFAMAGAALAGESCYSPREAEAEQLLRLHSKLMVTAITCRQSGAGDDLVSAYTSFTRRNLNRIRDAEQTLIAHYAKKDSKGSVSRLDRLRTILANEYGQKIANKTAPIYCAEERDLMVPVAAVGDDGLSREVLKLSSGARTLAPSCGTASRGGRSSG